MKRWFFLFCIVGFAWGVRAALPDAVVQACLAPRIFDATSGQSWTLMTAADWANGAMDIAESAEASTFTQVGKPHPMDWATTALTLTQPNPGAERPESEQRLEITFRAKAVVPEMEIDLWLIDKALLPPCEVIKYQGKLAIVSKQKDWYILAGDSKMTVTQTDESPQKTTLQCPKTTVKKLTTFSASLYVGEGALP